MTTLCLDLHLKMSFFSYIVDDLISIIYTKSGIWISIELI